MCSVTPDLRTSTTDQLTNDAADNLEPALKLYEKALEGGIERASQNVRSISAKILTKKAAAGSTAQAPAS